MFYCCETGSKKDKDAIDVMPVADESVTAISFQQVDNSVPFPHSALPTAEIPVTPVKRELTREQTLDAKEKLPCDNIPEAVEEDQVNWLGAVEHVLQR